MMMDEQPDVMGVQDALLDQLSYIDNKFIKQYRRIGVGRDNGLTRGKFNAIYYDYNKLDVLEYHTKWISKTPERVSPGWDTEGPRIITYGLFRTKETGVKFLYINVHFDEMGPVSKRETLKLIASIIATPRYKTAPIIVGGDWEGDIEDDIFDLLRNNGLESARRIAERTDYRGSYNAFNGNNKDIYDEFMVRRIIPKKFMTIIKGYGVKHLSDHYPIAMLFDL
jgi:endonuclease/exonuclease/phosphatase family metal-dependent hydrolase